MLRYFRIDRPTQRKPLRRRLALQQLEERLTLSTTSPTPSTGNHDLSIEGGFVNVGVLYQDFTLNGSDFTPIVVTSFGESLLSDALAGLRAGDVSIGDLLNLSMDGVSQEGIKLSIIPPPDPFPPEPGGGMVGPIVERQPFGPLPAEETSPAAGSFVAEATPMVEEMPQRRAHEIVLGRGREVFFMVATLAPPRTIVRPDRIALDTRTAHHAPAQTESASPGVLSAPAARTEQSQGPLATESPTEATVAEQSTAEKVGSVSGPHKTGRAVRSTTTHDSIRANQTVPASLLEAATPLPASQSATAVVSEAEARSQVFADWRNRDLIALPLLVTLAAGPRLVRSLRPHRIETQQLPPQRNRHTITL